MAGQNVTYVVRGDDSNLLSMFARDERAALSLEKSIAGANDGLRTMASIAGIGFGAHALFSGAKDWIEDVGTLETGLLRIKNASQDLKDGLKNQLFIRKEVDDFKIDLEKGVDAYGMFLLKIKNAGLGADMTRHLYDNILTISKVSALPQNEIDATVRNVGIMLGEGILEARHLRQLSYVHPQIVPFLAHAMGLKDNQKDAFASILKEGTDDQTAMQKLSLLMSGGKLTKMAINSKVILEAIEEYKNSVAANLPETLNTIQSGSTDVENSFLKMKETLIMDLKPEILALFEDIKAGTKWISEHAEAIIKVGKAVLDVTKIWLEYKTAMFLINGAQTTYNVLSGIFANKETAAIAKMEIRTSAISAQVAATNALTAAIERQMAIAAGGSGLVGYGGMALNTAGLAENSAIIGATKSGGLMAALSKLTLVATAVYIGGTLLDDFFDGKDENGKQVHFWERSFQEKQSAKLFEEMYAKGYVIMDNGEAGDRNSYVPREMYEYYKKSKFHEGNGLYATSGDKGLTDSWKDHSVLVMPKDELREAIFGAGAHDPFEIHMPGEKKKPSPMWGVTPNFGLAAASKDNKHIVAPNDKITGQQVKNYNITINGGVNGQKIDKQTIENGGNISVQQISEVIAQALESVVYDTEIRGD